jgi:protein-disulfide isomerase
MRLIILGLTLFVLFAMDGCKNASSGKKGKVVEFSVSEKEEDVLFGSPAAKKTVFMYASYNCTYCRLFFSQTLPELEKRYLNSGEIKLLVKFLDFSENPEVLMALQAASCISRFGIFEKFHPLLLVNPEVVFTEDFDLLIDDIMNENSEIAECILQNNNFEYIRSNLSEFRANNLVGTPTFIINNKAYRGFLSFDEFEQILKTEYNF